MFNGNWERKSIKNMIREDWLDEEVDDQMMVPRNLREERISSRKRVGQTQPFVHRT